VSAERRRYTDGDAARNIAEKAVRAAVVVVPGNDPSKRSPEDLLDGVVPGLGADLYDVIVNAVKAGIRHGKAAAS
jgi:hypothetical protein